MKQFKVKIVTKSGKNFTFTWSCGAGAIMHADPSEVLLLQDQFTVRESPAGEITIVPVGSIDYYSMKPLPDKVASVASVG
jgi:hypothetical protein